MIDEEKLKNIENLHRLKTEGVITEEDFEKAKNDLLHGPVRKAAKSTVMGASATDVLLPNRDDWIGWMVLPIRRYADFTGRSGRREFWMYMLGSNVGVGLFTLLALSQTDEYGDMSSSGSATFALIVLALLGLVVPTLSVQARRFHDQDKSGWFTLLNLIPYVGPIVVLIFMALEGTHGENQYGPDPMA